MELEEMKNRWASLEEQLKKQEILNEKLIREIRCSKSGPLRQLINYTLLGIIVCVAMIPFYTYVYYHSDGGGLKSVIFALAYIILFSLIIVGAFNLNHLRKIDFTKSVSDNIRLVYAYKINIRRQCVLYYISWAVFVLLCVGVVIFSFQHLQVWRLVGIGIAVVAGIAIACLEYKKMYKAKTNAILKSLEELRELEG